MQNVTTGTETIRRLQLVSMLNEMEMAPTIMRKIVPGPRIEETNITIW